MEKQSQAKPELEKCSICLATMEEHEETMILYCGHKFHKLCITQWFEASAKERCPICRADSQGNPPSPSTPSLETLFDNDFNFMDTLDSEPFFGAFVTEEGDNVYVYESPLGIIMVRTLNITVPIPVPPIGTQYIRLPTRSVRGNYSRLYNRGRLRRFFRRARNGLHRMMSSCFR